MLELDLDALRRLVEELDYDPLLVTVARTVVNWH